MALRLDLATEELYEMAGAHLLKPTHSWTKVLYWSGLDMRLVGINNLA